MVLYINENNEIKDVNVTTDNSLIPFEIGENDYNPFVNWSIVKICCHAIQIKDGKLNGFYPYVDSRVIEKVDLLAKENASTQAQLDYVTMMSDIDI